VAKLSLILLILVSRVSFALEYSCYAGLGERAAKDGNAHIVQSVENDIRTAFKTLFASANVKLLDHQIAIQGIDSGIRRVIFPEVGFEDQGYFVEYELLFKPSIVVTLDSGTKMKFIGAFDERFGVPSGTEDVMLRAGQGNITPEIEYDVLGNQKASFCYYSVWGHSFTYSFTNALTKKLVIHRDFRVDAYRVRKDIEK
jgi:hypothetical protein